MTSHKLPPPTERIERRSSGDQAASYIRRLIFEGELRPGDHVPQEEVARTLGISRIPVREGLISLESEGWVTIQMHRGAFINALDEDAVLDHYELYGMTYGFAAKRATERSGPELGDRLRDIEAAMRTTDDADEFHRLTIEFHATVVTAARSPRVKVLLRGMSGLIPGNFFAEVPGATDVERKGAAAIVRAIRRGDADAAAVEYQRTLQRQGALVVKLLAERGLFDPPRAASQSV
jgi:DNA-binding GntR family transcriptional regulator